MSRLIFSDSPRSALLYAVSDLNPSSVHIVTDTTVARIVLPQLDLPWSAITAIPAGEEFKDLASLQQVWTALIEAGVSRRSVIINIGGGMVTDLGGFAAATFKRGVRFINFPTTLLSAVDAAVGGKTGINFGGLKNEIGAFAPAEAVVISATPFATLPVEQLLSGYAEMMKHALLSGPTQMAELLQFDPVTGSRDTLLQLLERSIAVKERIVAADPTEQGMRKSLNLGHTAGHAIEALAINRGNPLPHGYAVAAGLGIELVLSHLLKGFPSESLRRYIQWLRTAGYPRTSYTCRDYKQLVSLMRHDKKNTCSAEINFTLLSSPGTICIDCTVGEEEINAALDIYRDMME
ncbi:MAG: 3-dehydroquinate synthase [Duncaniella sp.]|nr:3-dehydroquinate synthase [Duncaniella sp.]